MKFTSQVTCVGMKASQGEFEGTAYDYTRAYCLVDMDTSKGAMAGQSVAEYNIGDSKEFDKFKHLPFPFRADADFEMVTNGKTTKTTVRAFRPIADQSPSKK